MNIPLFLGILLGFLAYAHANALRTTTTRITLGEDAQAICKKYRMLCKHGKICAMQHIDNWHRNITLPVCVPLSYIPAAYREQVRSAICKQPIKYGECGARYLRWYYNSHTDQCSWFTFGGCKGNENNFKSKTECEKTCHGASERDLAMAGLTPNVLTAPVFEAPEMSKFEALNSVVVTGSSPAGSDNSYDRYQIRKQRKVKDDKDRRRKRRRLNKEKRRRQLRRERKRQKRLLKKKQMNPETEAVTEEKKERRKRNHKRYTKKDRKNKRKKKNRKKKNKKMNSTTTELPVMEEFVPKTEVNPNSEPMTSEQNSLRHTLS